jgi:NAD(P)-dependent dehydrogenase (short-subunit alcohol dehydrogenase family)
VPDLTGRRAVVVGASRGLGRGIAETFSAAGASVLAIGRDQQALAQLAAGDANIEVIAADALDPHLPATIIAAHDPDIVAVVAGAAPPMHPIQQHTWESFSRTWNVDVQLTFNWLRAALLAPLGPGSRVLLMSSGAAIAGSPLSGGYAGAKATIRLMAEYADAEAKRDGLDITVRTVLPRLTPATGLGREAVRLYAERAGVSEEQYVARMGAPVTPAAAGRAFAQLAATGEADAAVAYTLTGDDGLRPLPAGPPAR